jgi:uncharacterized protein (TIGR02594 family)
MGEVVVDVTGNIDKLLRDFAAGKAAADRWDQAMARGVGQTVRNFQGSTDRLEASTQRLSRSFMDTTRSADRYAAAVNRAKVETVAAARATETSMASIRSTLLASAGIFATALGINRIREMADGYTSFTNRLRAAGIEGANLRDRQEELFQIAQRYGVELESIGTLYGRLSQTQRELGASNQQVMQTVEGAAAAVRVYGASTQEQAGAIRQLSQMLGNAKVQMQEFNSLNDGARPILQAVANGIERFHGSVSALRSEIMRGGFDTKELFEGMQRGLPAIIEQANRMPLTIGASFVTLNNALGRYIGQTDQAIGATRFIGAAIAALANNLNVIIPILTAIIVAIGARYVAALGRATVASIRKVAVDAAAALAANVLANAQGRVTTTLGASIIPTGAYAGALGGVTLAANAATAGLTRMQIVMASAGAIARGVGASILAAFGGWVGVAIFAVVGAVILYNRSVAKARQELEDYNEETRESNGLLAEEARHAGTARAQIQALGQHHQTATGYVTAFAGATGDAANALYQEALQARNARVELLKLQAQRARESERVARERYESYNQNPATTARYGDIRSTSDVAEQEAARVRTENARRRAEQLEARAAEAERRSVDSYYQELHPHGVTGGRDIAQEIVNLNAELVGATRANNQFAMRELVKQIRIRRRITELMEHQRLSLETANAQAEAEALGAGPQANPGRDVDRADRARVLTTAQRYLGMNERRDRNPLMGLFREAGLSVDPQMVKWCAAFVNAVLAANGLPGTGSLAARSFETYGERTTTPQPGDIVTLRIEGNVVDHVGIFAGFDRNGNVRVVGGNQSDHRGGGVTTSTFRPNQVSSFRRVPTADQADRIRDQQISRDEAAARELQGLSDQLIAATRDQTVDAVALAAMERTRINAERDRERDETAAKLARGDYNEAQAALILAKNEELRTALLHNVDLREQQRTEGEAAQIRAQSHETAISILEAQQEIARTATERRAVERRILAAQKEFERAVLQAKIDSPFTTPLDRRLATNDMGTLDQRYQARGGAIDRQTRDDLLNSAPENSESAYRQQLATIREQEEERKRIVAEALTARLILEEEAARRRVEIERDAQRQLREAELERNLISVTAARETADSLLDITKTLFGEQSKAYRAMFVVSKAFAIAEAVMKIQVALANALSLPFPANIPAIASVAALGATIIGNIAAISAQFDAGGWTGDGPQGGVAGLVHYQEHVTRAGPARRYRPLLEDINAGRDPTARLRAGGGGGFGGRLQVSVHNHAPGVEHEVRQLGPGEVEIIAKRAVEKHAPGVVAADLQRPNSRTSKALTRSTQTRRKR